MKVYWQNGGLYFEPENGNDHNLLGHMFDMACAQMTVTLTAVGMPAAVGDQQES